MLPYSFLGWAGQRAPIHLLYTTCRSLNCHVDPALAASFLAEFWGSERTERCFLMRDEVVQKTRWHKMVHACCARCYGQQRRLPMFWPAATTGFYPICTCSRGGRRQPR